MNIPDKDKRERLREKLLRLGFTKGEAKAISYQRVNQNSDELQPLDSPFMKATLSKAIIARRNYLNNCRAMGWSDRDIYNALVQIDRALKDRGEGNMAWLRQEYMIPSKAIIDYHQATARRELTRKGHVSRIIRTVSKVVSNGLTYKARPIRMPKSYTSKMAVKNQVNQENRLI
jgi:hypothetical protein